MKRWFRGLLSEEGVGVGLLSDYGAGSAGYPGRRFINRGEGYRVGEEEPGESHI
ncbi:hypothetical protein Hanom_Chr03g00197201 [Helianthus anomalus]